jgi:hypothetical protein
LFFIYYLFYLKEKKKEQKEQGKKPYSNPYGLSILAVLS